LFNLESIIQILNDRLKNNFSVKRKLIKKPTARSLQKYILVDKNDKKYLLEIASNNIEIFYFKRTIEYQEKFSKLEHDFKLNMPLYIQFGNKFSYALYEYFDDVIFLKDEKPIKLLKKFNEKNSIEIELNDKHLEKVVKNFLSAWPNIYHSMIKRQKLFSKWINELRKCKTIKVSFEHGDFNGENIVLIQNQVYLFDFEFAKDFQPIGFDIYDYYKLKKTNIPDLEHFALHKIKYELIDKINQKIDEDPTLEIYDEIDEDATLKNNWKALYEKGANYNLSLEWCETWLRYFKKENQELFVFTIWNDDKLMLLAPLYKQKNTLYLIGSEPDLYDSFDILYEDRKYIKYFFTYIFTKDYQIDFRYLDSKTIVAKELIKYFYQNKLLYKSTVIDTKPLIKLDKFEFSTKERSDIKRVKNRAIKNYNLEIDFAYSIQKDSKFIEEFIKIHKQRWQGGPFENIKNFDSFIKDITKTDLIVLSRLSLGKKTIAYHLGYKDSKNILTSAIPAYSNEYNNISPGKVLIYELINYVKNRECQLFDFGRGAEEYKYWFANESTVLFHIKTYPENNILIKIKNLCNKVINKLIRITNG